MYTYKLELKNEQKPVWKGENALEGVCIKMYDCGDICKCCYIYKRFKNGFFKDILEKSILFDEQKHTV